MREKNKGRYGVEQWCRWHKPFRTAEADQFIQCDKVDADDTCNEDPTAAGVGREDDKERCDKGKGAAEQRSIPEVFGWQLKICHVIPLQNVCCGIGRIEALVGDGEV